VCDHLITAAKRRDHAVARRINERLLNILHSANGAWSRLGEHTVCTHACLSVSRSDAPAFWKLDVWEDDSRRRKRFVPDAYGSRHEQASGRQQATGSKSPGAGEPVSMETARQQLLDILIAKNVLTPNSSSFATDLIDEQDIASMLDGSAQEQAVDDAGTARTIHARTHIQTPTRTQRALHCCHRDWPLPAPCRSHNRNYTSTVTTSN
jgi:hypothetical protein